MLTKTTNSRRKNSFTFFDLRKFEFHRSFNGVLMCPTLGAGVSGGVLVSSIISGCIMEIFVPLNSLRRNPGAVYLTIDTS